MSKQEFKDALDEAVRTHTRAQYWVNISIIGVQFLLSWASIVFGGLASSALGTPGLAGATGVVAFSLVCLGFGTMALSVFVLLLVRWSGV